MLRRGLLLWVLLSACTLMHGQSRYHFFTLGTEQGLSDPFSWAAAQDKYGFMWIGTVNGLNRFDGHSIKQYFHDPKDSFSLPGNGVFWIYKDQAGELWISCGWRGVVRYNYEKDRFEKFAPYEALKTKLKIPAPVWRMGEDQMGRLYFACGGACFRYTRSTGAFEDLTPLFNGEIDNYGVAMFIPQGKKDLWVLTDNGLFLYDLLKNKISQVPFDKEKLGYGLNAMHDAEFINDEEMLISMGRPGFVLFNTRTWKFRPAPAPFNPEHSKIFTETGGVMKDSKGRIWLANSLYGLVEYFPKTNTTYSLKNEASYPYPHPEQEGQGMNVFEDKDGNIWYCNSLRGVVWFHPTTEFIKVFQRNYSDPTSLGGHAVYSFIEGGRGDILVGTNKGLSRYLRNDGKFQNFAASVNYEGKNPAAFIWAMTASEDSVFMATDMGLSAYSKKNGGLSRFVNTETGTDTFALFNNRILQIHYTSPGELILINNQAGRFDYAAGKCFYNYNSDSSDPLYQFTGIELSAYDRSKKRLWLKANGGKLFEYVPATKKSISHQFAGEKDAENISAIAAGKNGLLLIGTASGLHSYDPVSRKTQKIYSSGGAAILNIAVRDNDIWLSNAREITKINGRTGEASSFNINTLLPHSSIHRNSIYLDEYGGLWIGTNKGFCLVDTKNFKAENRISGPVLVNFTVFDKTKTFNKAYYELKEIRLKHNENFFSFDISALDYHQAAGIQYAYQLKGFDKDWKIASRNSASYTNVPPGTYELRLRTQHSSGLWKEADPILVYIRAPFWQSWWFISAIAFLFAILVFAIYGFIKKRKRAKRIDNTIDYFANSLYGENSIHEICWDIARNCISQLKLEDCVVYLLDEKRNVLVQKAAFGPKNPKEHEIVNPIEIRPGEGIVGTAAQTAKPVIVRDTTRDSRYIVDDHHRLSELAVPIIHEGRAIGVIDSEHSRKNFFTDDHVKALSTIAAISANKIAEAKAEEAARLSQIQLLEIKKLLAESQLMALRAQMNPHFVFNCLNSIQECIVTEKYGEASLYLNKFSKLFRSVLNNSGRGLVNLAEEIEVLELYLALEHMRFEKSFHYRIEVDEELEADEIQIPSMLLQPYVENALWHGLMHKESDRNLDICFKKLSEDVFQCVIDDNGIGRKKALELKAQQSRTKRHVSKGMSISSDRIELLRKQEQHALLEIIDKYEDTEAAGTRVVIELSTYLKS